MSGHVFRRSAVPNPPVAVAAHGSTIVDADGREYLDAAGGAVVVNVGHGRREVAEVIAEQAAACRTPTARAFTTEPLERYAAEVGAHLPVDEPYLYPVVGGSEAIETRPQARPRARSSPVASWTASWSSPAGAATTATRWARSTCRVASRSAGRTSAWLGRFRHVSAAYPYRGGEPGCPRTGRLPAELADELERAISRRGRPTWPHSWPSRSWGPRWAPSSRRRATGRRSPRSAAGTGCC